MVESRLFGVLAVRACHLSGANPRRLTLLFAVGMFVVSGLVNNLTALVLVLPMLLALFKLLGARRRYVAWSLGLMLVACNLGGASTPIGDFPAVLLLGRGMMSFSDYLVRAYPATFVTLVVLLSVALLVGRPSKGMPRRRASARLTVAAIEALYRNVRVDGRLLWPASAALGAMVCAWTLLPRAWGITPELVCWIGAGAALLARPKLGERLLRHDVDVEATLFLFSLFIMVVAVRKSGMFTTIAHALTALPVSPTTQLVIFLLVAGVLTGIFSAGPSMAALLEVAEALAQHNPPRAVYVGLALSVCAGSSLFLTAATSGPLAQALTERAELEDPDGARIRFGMLEFLPIGLLAFTIIQSAAIAWTLWAVH